MITAASISVLADLVLADVPNHCLAYAEPANAPDSWFNGLDSLVDRILITAGGDEIFVDDITRFSQTLTQTKSNLTFVIQEEGIHDGPLIDYLSGQSYDDPKSLYPVIVRWLKAGITDSNATLVR